MEQVHNPYAAPVAAVDGAQGDEEFQKVRLFSTAGRIGRVRYLAYLTATYFLLFVVIGFFAGMMAMARGTDSMLFLIVMAAGYVAMLAQAIFLAVQRCHDCDNAGWWVFLMLVPGINLILILYLLFMPGTAGRNRFGAPTPPNSTGAVILACVFPLLFVIGIVAAIALPAYQTRTLGGPASVRAPR